MRYHFYPKALQAKCVESLLLMCTRNMQEGIRKLESIVHPLVAKHRQAFLQSVAEEPGRKLVVLDIPLLFETKGENEVQCNQSEVNAIMKLSSLLLHCVTEMSKAEFLY